ERAGDGGEQRLVLGDCQHAKCCSSFRQRTTVPMLVAASPAKIATPRDLRKGFCMSMIGRSVGAVALAGMLWAIGGPPAAAQRARASDKEIVIRIPREGTPDGMFTRVCLTGVRNPAPLVIINHGSPPSAEDRPSRKASPCGEVAQFFTSRGYVVAFPLRRGYGETGG